MAKILDQNELNKRLVKKTQDGTVGTSTKEPMDDDDVGVQVHVGDVYHEPSKPSGAREDKPVPTDTDDSRDEQPSFFRRALPYAAAVGLGAAGMGVFSPFVFSMLQPGDAETPAPEREVIERRTDTDFRIGEPTIEDR